MNILETLKEKSWYFSRMHARESAVPEEPQSEEKELQKPERPLSGAAARNFHRQAAGRPELPPCNTLQANPLTHTVLGYSDKGPCLNHDF